jgi:hypothetical protein
MPLLRIQSHTLCRYYAATTHTAERVTHALTSVRRKLSAEGHEGGKGGGGVLHVLVLLPGQLAAVAVNVEGKAHADRQLGRLARERQAAPCASVFVLLY